MNTIKPFAVLLPLILFTTHAFCQTPDPAYISNYINPVQILPPSPNAASLGKFGGLDLGLWSGGVSKNIPIYTYLSNKLNVPISINYSSTGLKIDEIASRVGMGWSLNAGGVITRTVRGSIDEKSQRINPPTGLAMNYDMIKFMNLITGDNSGVSGNPGQGPLGHFDAQPDLFSFNFNGYSGQFILDTSFSEPTKWKSVLLTHSNLKIDISFASGSANFKFIITSEDGTRYIFDSHEFTSSYDSLAAGSCATNYDEGVATAWYLSEIIHPDNDTISFSYIRRQFSYETSISQTKFKHNPSSDVYWKCTLFNPNVPIPILYDATCINKLKTDGLILDEITSTHGGKVKFTYTDRNDYDDKLLSAIDIYLPAASSPYQTFQFLYISGSRPFLMSLIEEDTLGHEIRRHSFNYNDFANLPQRLSFSQDHWGYYNGKPNSTLIPSSLYSQQNFPSATANRDPDAAFCMQGLLCSITYPTGGKDSIVYEGNQVYKQIAVQAPDTTVSLVATNLYYQNYSSLSSGYFKIPYSQNVSFYGSRNSVTIGDPTLSSTGITLYDEANNVVHGTTLQNSDPASETFSANLTLSGTYRIQIDVTGPGARGEAHLTFKNGSVTYPYANVNSGGVRVAKVLTYDTVSNKPMIKRYFYNKSDDSEISSGVGMVQPLYDKNLTLYKPCREIDSRYPCDDVSTTQYFSMHSNSIFSVYVNGFAPTAYDNVTESFGDDFENGGIEHHFSIVTNNASNQYSGNEIINAPESDNSYINGKETFQWYFKKIGSFKVPTKKLFFHYKIDSAVNRQFMAFVGDRKYVSSCTIYGYPLQNEINQFNLRYYLIHQRWMYVDTATTQIFDDTGTSYVEEKLITTYANPNHALPTSVQKFDSRNQKETIWLKYPLDYVVSGAPNNNVASGIRHLQDHHIISAVIEQYLQKSNADGSDVRTIAGSFTTYKPASNLPDSIFSLDLASPLTNFVPASISETSTSKNDNYLPSVVFDNYDVYGNNLERHKMNDIKEVHLWGYNFRYPVARIIGADYKTAVGLIDQTILVNADGQYTDDEVRTEVDKIRTGLPDAQVFTYTFAPMVGMTSETDPAGRTSYYEYDSFGRLALIRDQDRNIVKKICYNYQGQNGSCPIGSR